VKLSLQSHELRTPLSACFGLLGLLAETALDQEQQDFVQTARSSCELLLDIIDSLLDYSKLEAGQLKLFHSSAPTEDAAADCLELLTPLAVGKGLELSYNSASESPPAVCVRPTDRSVSSQSRPRSR
jgi:signal transduction histidine kinase